jgi:hypothetical protein
MTLAIETFGTVGVVGTIGTEAKVTLAMEIAGIVGIAEIGAGGGAGAGAGTGVAIALGMKAFSSYARLNKNSK